MLSYLDQVIVLGYQKTNIVVQSTTEAEYVSASKDTSQAIWRRRIFENIGEKQKKRDCSVL